MPLRHYPAVGPSRRASLLASPSSSRTVARKPCSAHVSTAMTSAKRNTVLSLEREVTRKTGKKALAAVAQETLAHAAPSLSPRPPAARALSANLDILLLLTHE